MRESAGIDAGADKPSSGPGTADGNTAGRIIARADRAIADSRAEHRAIAYGSGASRLMRADFVDD